MNSANDNIRKKAESMLSKSNTQFASMTPDAIQKLLYEFQVHHIELELQNEELKNSQHELTLSRDRYARLYNSSPIGYLTLNEAGVIQKANPAAAQLLDSDPKKLVNKKLGQFINPLDQDIYYFFIQDLLANHTEKTLITRLNILSSEGAYLDCQGFKYCGCLPESCIYNGGFIYAECRGTYSIDENDDAKICLSILDITATRIAHETITCLNEKLERKIYEQTKVLTDTNQDLVKHIDQLNFYKNQILEREVMLNSIFNAAVEGIITTHLSGNIIYVNDTVESIFGYKKEEIINCNINKLIPLARQKKPTKYLNNLTGIGLLNVVGELEEVYGVRKQGTTVPLDISTAKFIIDGTVYLTCIVRDVSSRKLQKQRDQEHLDELAHVTRLGLMGEMASGIAHQVNQPLTAITGYTQTCLNLIQNKNYDQELLTEILIKTNQQAIKAGQIIHRMRDFVKSKNIHRSTIDINNLIEDAVSLCESYLKQNSVIVQLKLKKKLPYLCIDSIQIEQVILNLIRNSIDALSNLPRLKSRNLSIHTNMNSNNEIEIRIKDNGPGIDAMEQQRILTPFYTSKPDGMGMGLSICRSIIEAHEGALSFNSKPKKGTTFYFTLPVRSQTNGI